jgi:hypothetical protein
VGGLIETVGSLVDRRRLTATWLPVIAFCLAIGGVIVAARGWRDTTTWWNGLGTAAQPMLIGALIVGTVLIGQLLAARRISLLRLYEGYWPAFPGAAAITRRMRAPHLELQKARSAETADLFLNYPRWAKDVRPTRLGNILRAAADHPRRYGIVDAVTAWTRLYVTLPEQFTTVFAAAAANLEAAVTISFLGIVFALGGGVLGAAVLPWWGAMLCVWGGALAGWLGYRAAVRAALPYAQLIRTAFDVYRFGLLEAMGLELPTGFDVERDQWEQLGKVWYHGFPDSYRASLLRYPQPAPAGPAAAPASSAAVSEPAAEAGRASDSPARSRRRTLLFIRLLAKLLRRMPKDSRSRMRLLIRFLARSWQRMPLLLIGILVAGLAAAGVAAVRTGERADGPNGDGLVAARQLPAYHVLEPDDVRRNAGSRTATDLYGRYTLRPVPEGAALRMRDLGPVLTRPLTGRQISTVTVVDAQLARRGEVVRLLVAGPPGQPTPIVQIDDVVVLDTPGGTTLVVAITPPGLTQLVQTAAGGTVHVVLG